MVRKGQNHVRQEQMCDKYLTSLEFNKWVDKKSRFCYVIAFCEDQFAAGFD